MMSTDKNQDTTLLPQDVGGFDQDFAAKDREYRRKRGIFLRCFFCIFISLSLIMQYFFYHVIDYYWTRKQYPNPYNTNSTITLAQLASKSLTEVVLAVFPS